MKKILCVLVGDKTIPDLFNLNSDLNIKPEDYEIKRETVTFLDEIGNIPSNGIVPVYNVYEKGKLVVTIHSGPGVYCIYEQE